MLEDEDKGEKPRPVGRKLFQESSQICALNSLFSLLNETVISGENSDTTRYLCVSETEVLKLRYDKKT